jgi:O-antigen/teichoic acid export membrane protein
MRTPSLLRYAKGIFLLNLPLSVHTIISLVTLPVVLNYIDAADYGKWQFILALQVWTFALTADNITRATKRGIAKGLDGTFIYGFLARLKLIVPFSLVLLAIAFYIFFSGNKVIALLLVILSFYFSIGYLFQVTSFEYLIAKKQFKLWSVWQIIISGVSLCGGAFIAYFTKNIVYFGLFHLGSISITSICLWVMLLRRDALFESYRQRIIDKDCVPYGIKLIPVELVGAAASKISYFFITPYFGYTNLAFFSVADKLRERGIGIIRSLRPLLYTDFTQTPRNKIAASVNRNIARLLLAGLFLALVFTVAAWLYITNFLPDEFYVSFSYFAVLAVGIPAVLMAVVLHTALEAHLRYKELTVIGIIPNVLKVLFVLLGGYVGGVLGVCIGVTAGVWISLVFYYTLALRLEYIQKIVAEIPFLTRLSEY